MHPYSKFIVYTRGGQTVVLKRHKSRSPLLDHIIIYLVDTVTCIIFWINLIV